MKIKHFTTGEEVPKGAVFMQSVIDTREYGAGAQGTQVWHYFLVK